MESFRRPEGKDAKEMVRFRRDATRYLVSDGVLYRRRRTNEPPARVIVRKEKREGIMRAIHEENGHRGREGTMRKVTESYWWPEMHVDIKEWVKTCEQCEKRAPTRYAEPMKSLTVNRLWQRVGLDISYLPRTENGHHLLVVAREYLSGWVEARPLPKGTSEKVTDLFYEEIICRYGMPESVVVDGGAENKKRTDLPVKRYNTRKITVPTM